MQSTDAALTMFALKPVWLKSATPKRSFNARPGPNGEDPTTGSWKLALPDGQVYAGPTISPSALETATACPRSWALSRLDNLERPGSPRADLGSERHSELEAWLRYHQAPSTTGMARVLPHFPMPAPTGSGVRSEELFGFIFGRDGREIVFSGWKDARLPPDAVSSVGSTPVVYDLKTTGDFRWKKTPTQLRENLQAAVYALDEMLRYGTDMALLRWVYAQLDGVGHVVRVETVSDGDVGGVLITKAQAVSVLEQYLDTAEMMLEAIGGGKKAADMAQNGDSCELYGGCGWKRIGGSENASPSVKPGEVACRVPDGGGGFFAQLKQARKRPDLVTITKERKDMALGSRFSKQLNGTAVDVVVPAPSKVEQVAAHNGAAAGAAPTAPVAASGSLVARLRSMASTPAAAAQVEQAAQAAPVRAVGVNPPDAAPEWTAEEQAVEAEKIANGGKLTAPGVDAPKRGRPAGSKNKTSAVAATTEAAPVAPTDIQALDEMARRWIAAGNRKGAALLLQAADSAA